LRVNILRLRCRGIALLTGAGQLTLEQLQTSLDVDIGRVKVCCTSIGVEGIGDLVVARLVQSAQIVPHLGDVGVQADSTRVSIERVTVLVDLVVKDTDRAPECGVATVAVDSLLVSLVGFGVLGLRHVAATEKVPTLRIIVVCNKQEVRLSSVDMAFELETYQR
jgi:hypothetical protein